MNWARAGIYALAVGPVLTLAVAAVRPRRPWVSLVVTLLYLAPVVLMVLGLGAGRSLGLLLASVLLLVAPVIPWRKRWARFAVPVTVLLVVLALIGIDGWGPVLTFWLNLSVVATLGALTVAAFGWLVGLLDGRSAHV